MRPDPVQVLLVDDSIAARLTFQALLEDAGWAVTEAASVADGRLKIVGGTFDLAVVDLQLGDGLGTELIPDLKRHQPRAVIAILSGNSPEPVAGVTLVLVKSGAPDALIRQLQDAVERKQQAEVV